MKAFTSLKTTAAVINVENIDTDQIIGSDHLKITNKNGLGKHLFSDWRYLSDGSQNPEFVLNKPQTQNAKVLIAGDNFGCGSSREHAPWALLDFGIRVVISSSIADIFFNNAIKNGLLPIKVSQESHQYLLQKNAQDIEISLSDMTIKYDEKTISFELEPFARYCLINGVDQLTFLMNHTKDIENYEQSLAAS